MCRLAVRSSLLFSPTLRRGRSVLIERSQRAPRNLDGGRLRPCSGCQLLQEGRRSNKSSEWTSEEGHKCSESDLEGSEESCKELRRSYVLCTCQHADHSPRGRVWLWEMNEIRSYMRCWRGSVRSKQRQRSRNVSPIPRV